MLVRIGVVSALVGGLAAVAGVAGVRQIEPSGNGQSVAAVRTRIPSPLDGLTRDQQFAKVKELDAQDAEKQNDVRRQFVGSGASLSTLKDVPMIGSLRGTSDLAQLTSMSTTVVLGNVTQQGMSDDLGSVISTVRIDQVLSGDSASGTIEIHQPGAPTDVGGDVVMLRSPGDPILIDGDQYLLFLQKCVNPAWSAFNCLGVLGDQYTVTDGRVALHVGDEEIDPGYWALSLNGLTVQELAAKLSELG